MHGVKYQTDHIHAFNTDLALTINVVSSPSLRQKTSLTTQLQL